MNKIRVILIVIVFAAGLYAFNYWNYNKVQSVIDVDDVISNSGEIHEGDKVIKANTLNNEAIIWIDDQATIVPHDALLEILSKYESKKSKVNYFPYENEKNVIRFTVIQSNEHRNFLLGDFNIWYLSNSEMGNEIINGDELLRKILALAGQK